MKKPRRARWIGLVAVASAGLLSGCYYYPYGYSPWGYPYPYPYPTGYPAAANPFPPAPGTALQYPQQPAPGAAAPQYPQQPAAGPPQPLDTPVQRTPLPPAPLPQ